MRCVHESKLHAQCCFITLTYNDDYVPVNTDNGALTLVKKHFQDFMKRFRRHIEPLKIRFYACGEYGDTTGRPHYHAIIFGYDFPDKQLRPRKSNSSYDTFTSETLSKLWPFGYHLIAGVNFDSCAYVARYVMKKLSGPQAEEKYDGLQKEFVLMSRRPGIAKDFYEKFKTDFFPSDECIVYDNGKVRKLKPPKYYDRLFDIECPDIMEEVKTKRKIQALKNSDIDADSGVIPEERLRQKEAYARSKLKNLKRSL